MASNPLECMVCNEGYSEGKHCPRILSCSHTFCSDCIDRLITVKRDLRCPLCRCPFYAFTKEEVIINRAILEMAEMTPTLDGKYIGIGKKKKKKKKQEKKNDKDVTDMNGAGATCIQMTQPSGPTYMTSDCIQRMDGDLKDILKEGRLWAYREDEGRMWFSQVEMVSENALHLHHMSLAKRPPFDAHLIKHDDFLRLVGSSSRKTFLELGLPNGNSLGRFAISLVDEGRYPDNFFRLCLGVNQRSYANCSILGIWNKSYTDERIFAGDYERNNGTGGQAVLRGVNWREEYDSNVYKRTSLKAGSVAAWSSREDFASLFFIYTKDNDNPSGYPSFGMVDEEGIAIIRDVVSQYRDISIIMIITCGVEVPISQFSDTQYTEGNNRSYC